MYKYHGAFFNKIVKFVGFCSCVSLFPHSVYLVPGISATPMNDNLRYFNVIVEGPSETPFQGKFRELFYLKIDR